MVIGKKVFAIGSRTINGLISNIDSSLIEFFNQELDVRRKKNIFNQEIKDIN